MLICLIFNVYYVNRIFLLIELIHITSKLKSKHNSFCVTSNRGVDTYFSSRRIYFIYLELTTNFTILFLLQMSGFVLQILWENVLKFAESLPYTALAIVTWLRYFRGAVRDIVLQHKNHITRSLTFPVSSDIPHNVI